MATAWQSLEEAALTLGISSRTLHRRIVKGEFQTRLENGRREVLVSLPEPSLADDFSVSATASAMSDTPHNPPGDFAEQSQSIESGSDDDIGSTMLALHEDRIRRTDLAIMAYQQSVNVTAADARRTRRNARIAWSVAGGLSVALFLSATWATHSVTKAQAEVSHLGAVVRQVSDTADARSRDAEKFRVDAETAKLAAAKIEGQLDAAKTRIDELSREKSAIESKLSAATQPPSTQPARQSG